MDQDAENVVSEVESIDQLVLDETSLPFVGRWNQLVSHTNWEKGRIIYQWRDALVASGAPATEYSDEAWSRRVGGVTGQHVGRLRRVYQRFGQVRDEFPELFWSHFQAAIDWDDAEMWLEGAVQNDWSVSQMRNQRWETLGAVEADQPSDDQIVANELDEDFEPALNERPKQAHSGGAASVETGPREEGPDFGGDETQIRPAAAEPGGAAVYSDDEPSATVEFVRPFADLAELPEDLADAFEAFKLAILHHKLDNWQAISREDVLASLEALKQLVVAPSAAE